MFFIYICIHIFYLYIHIYLLYSHFVNTIYYLLFLKILLLFCFEVFFCLSWLPLSSLFLFVYWCLFFMLKTFFICLLKLGLCSYLKVWHLKPKHKKKTQDNPQKFQLFLKASEYWGDIATNWPEMEGNASTSTERWDMSTDSPIAEHRGQRALPYKWVRIQLKFFNEMLKASKRD